MLKGVADALRVQQVDKVVGNGEHPTDVHFLGSILCIGTLQQVWEESGLHMRMRVDSWSFSVEKIGESCFSNRVRLLQVL